MQILSSGKENHHIQDPVASSQITDYTELPTTYDLI